MTLVAYFFMNLMLHWDQVLSRIPWRRFWKRGSTFRTEDGSRSRFENASFTSYIFCIFGTPRDEQSLHYVFLKGKSLISLHSGSFSNRTHLHGFSWKETFHLTRNCYCLDKQTLRNYVVAWEAKFSPYKQSQQTARTQLLQWDRTISALKRSTSD